MVEPYVQFEQRATHAPPIKSHAAPRNRQRSSSLRALSLFTLNLLIWISTNLSITPPQSTSPLRRPDPSIQMPLALSSHLLRPAWLCDDRVISSTAIKVLATVIRTRPLAVRKPSSRVPRGWRSSGVHRQ